jgi:LacI family transcriptional regulator
MAITIKDIARQAGVSHATVSRALHSSPLISADTSERIRKMAEQLGYMPSVAARSLKTNRSQVLGVIVSSIEDPYFSEVLQGIDDTARETGYSLFMAASGYDPENERWIVQSMREHRVDGVIICSTPFSAGEGRRFLGYGTPIVVINNQSAEEYPYAIYHDNKDGSRQLTHHLIKLGHRHIAYLGNSLSGRTTNDRLEGFQLEMEDARMKIKEGFILQVAGGGPEEGAKALAHFLNLPSQPTAYLCFNDMMAIGLLQGLQTAGLRVPEDCSVAGFDNIKFSAYTNPPLTTFDQPKKNIGAEATRLMLDLLDPGKDNQTLPDSIIRVQKGSLLVRESTAPPPVVG